MNTEDTTLNGSSALLDNFSNMKHLVWWKFPCKNTTKICKTSIL